MPFSTYELRQHQRTIKTVVLALLAGLGLSLAPRLGTEPSPTLDSASAPEPRPFKEKVAMIPNGDYLPGLPNSASASVQWSTELHEFVAAYQMPVNPPLGCDAAYEIGFALIHDPRGAWEPLPPLKIGVNSATRPCGARNPTFVVEGQDWTIMYEILNPERQLDIQVAIKRGNLLRTQQTMGLESFHDLVLAHHDDIWIAWGRDRVTGQLKKAASADLSCWTLVDDSSGFIDLDLPQNNCSH